MICIARWETSEMFAFLSPRWSQVHQQSSPFSWWGIPSCTPPHKANKTLIFQPRRTLSSKQLIWASESKYIYIFIQEVISLLQALSWVFPIGMEGLPCDYSFTVANPSLWAFVHEGRDGSGNQGLARTFRADQDDWPQTLQALNQVKLQTCFSSSRCWPCSWPAPLGEAWRRGSFDCVFDPSYSSHVFPTATVSGLFYPLSTRGPVTRVWEVFKGLQYLRLGKKKIGSNIGKVNYKIKFKVFTYVLPQSRGGSR